MKERISALMDGELDEREAAELIASISRDPEARATWRAYHRIGDVLRESPPVTMPAVRPWQWRFALPAVAVAAAVALVSWVAFVPQPQTTPAAALAQAKPPLLVPPPRAANDYLLAHQGFSPRVALQGMASYVRTVSEDVGEPAR